MIAYTTYITKIKMLSLRRNNDKHKYSVSGHICKISIQKLNYRKETVRNI